MHWTSHANRTGSEREVSQVPTVIFREDDEVDDHKTDGGAVSKLILISEKLTSGNRGLKTEMTGRNPGRRRRSAFDCSGIEEEEEDEKIVEFLLGRKCVQSGLTILNLKEYVFSNYVFVVQLSRNNDITYYYLSIYGGKTSFKIPLLLVQDVLIMITHKPFSLLFIAFTFNYN